MKYRTLGKTGLRVSCVTLGTWSMAGPWWGETNDEISIATLRRAVELGINTIDTADVYGYGHAEDLIARAFAGKRHEVIIASKVGLRWNNKGKVRHDLSAQYIEKAVDASLKRLNTDYIDLYQIHWPDPGTPVEATMESLNRCAESGKVRFIGVSNHSPEQIDALRTYGEIATSQPLLNLFERASEIRILPYCLQEDFGLLSYGTLCRGLLSGRFKTGDTPRESVRRRDPLFNGECYLRNLRIVESLGGIAYEIGATVAQLSIAWVTAHAAVTTAIAGARRPEQIEESAKAAEVEVDETLLRQIDMILATMV
jgi:aryl-alcohol dehydrogenase-like predicted oxidoreductase